MPERCNICGDREKEGEASIASTRSFQLVSALVGRLGCSNASNAFGRMWINRRECVRPDVGST